MPTLLPDVSDSPAPQGSIVSASPVGTHWHLGDCNLHLSHNKLCRDSFLSSWSCICFDAVSAGVIIHSNTWFIQDESLYLSFLLWLDCLCLLCMLSVSWMRLFIVVYLGSAAVFPTLHHFVPAEQSPGWIQNSNTFQIIISNGSQCQVCETSLIPHTWSDQAGEDLHAVLTGSPCQLLLPDLNLALWTTAHSIRKTVVYSTFWVTVERIFYYTI